MRLTGILPRALLGALLALAACSPQPAGSTGAAASAATAVHPVSGLPVVGLTVTKGAKKHGFRVEVARSDAEQSRGLMFRTAMAADEGMIFPYDPPSRVGFWMRNTVIPLDIIFIGADRRILNIAANAVPYSEAPLASSGPASLVLELNGGMAAELGIGPGDVVEWEEGLSQTPARRSYRPA
jgi:uncharacterized membrane protein (UPF0127 family)